MTEKEILVRRLTEKIEKTKDKNGYLKLRWIKTRDRNEALDITLLAYAGAKMLNLALRGKKR